MSLIIKKQGFTLVETLIYASGLVILLLVMLSLISTSYDWYRTATVGSRIDEIGVALTDHIAKDIRSGKSINIGSSSFGTTTGSVSINTVTNSTNIIKVYSLSNGRISYKEDGGSINYISPSDVTVTRFYITRIVTSASEAIKFDTDISYNTKTGTTTRTYTDVAIMRNSY